MSHLPAQFNAEAIAIMGRTIVAALFWLVSAGLLSAAERSFTAAQLDESALVEHLRLTNDRSVWELASGVLIEDDGPAAGYSYRPNVERLIEGIAVRKQLIIDDPRAKSATLLIGGQGKFQFEINGQPRELDSLGKSGSYWEMFRVPIDDLKQGINDFVIFGTGSIWIARDDEYAAGSTTRKSHPNRSAKRKNADQPWNDKQLGTKDDVDGEYYVRLHLEQFQRQGVMLLPVVDRANLSGDLIAPHRTTMAPLKIRIDRELTEPSSIEVRARSSDSPLFEQSKWSQYQTLTNAGGELVDAPGRYVQVEIQFTTNDPLASPQLRAVHFASESVAAQTPSLRVVDAKLDKIARSSIPFAYEALDHPNLAQFRKQFRLDEVVRGTKTEWEMIERLAIWTSRQWRNKGHLGQAYPAWNAIEILRQHDDGTPVGGFCQQYNLVLLQACESLGIHGRMVSIGPGSVPMMIKGGHEVVELWSNDYRKWAYVDGNQAWYARDAETKIPLSLLELRARQLAVLQDRPHREIQIITLAETDRKWERLTDWPPFVELRMIPRSNFLAEAAPLPLNQGMRGWFWTGHYAWSDDLAPRSLLYSHHVSRRPDWEWSVNLVELHLEATENPEELRVYLESPTPSFETFLAQHDEAAEKVVKASFIWPLKQGRNRLAVRSRNKLGRLGPESWIVVARK